MNDCIYLLERIWLELFLEKWERIIVNTKKDENCNCKVNSVIKMLIVR